MALLYFEKFCETSILPSSACSTINSSYNFTSEKIAAARNIFKKTLTKIPYKGKYCLVAVGSYGRYEASPESDLDGYVIYKKEIPDKDIRDINERIGYAACEAEIKLSGGFNPISLDDMYKNIGGKDDTNSSITNRILFLLESEWLSGQSFYSSAYRKILKKYLKDVIKFKKQVPRFLLSDIIRYYRTICVDYEFKITEENKDWAIRNIKLRFSRKGLYFGGIAVLLNSLNKKAEKRYPYIAENLGLPFADKISHILLEQKKIGIHTNILSLYAEFMEEISKKDVRAHLKGLNKSDREKDRNFRWLEKKSRTFNDSLRDLLDKGTWGHKNYIDFLVL